MVTVQLSPSSSCAIGLPTMFERPIDHRVEPGEVAELGLEQHAGSRAACRARSRRAPIASRPALTGWKPSTSLAGIDRGDAPLLASICARQRQLDEDSVDRGIGVEPVDQREQLGLRWCRREACARSSPSPLRASPCPWSGHRPRSPDPRRPARRRGPGARPVAARKSATSAATALAKRGGGGLPVDQPRGHSAVDCDVHRQPCEQHAHDLDRRCSTTSGEKSIPPKSGRILRIGR